MSTLKTMTDEELALAYVDGNNRAFDELLSRSQDKIFSYIIYIVKDEDLANDLFQETFLKSLYQFRKVYLVGNTHCTQRNHRPLQGREKQ